ncbi:hypothetical protein DRE_04010 [Drechslerella stenobrocha 248]|uniref:FMN hydroxy acid dehydrogenase domain-containing protein n=1 Tax=Drechslerella stenobrocha 248 TaxID=1043628 RepID=W7ICE0_9PEZI|nr:hypothetical protein DRE_04010 [Drechslerella stenobrocha 248]
MTEHGSYQIEIYGQFNPPRYPTDPTQWEALARRSVPSRNFTYVWGSATTGQTCRDNLKAFTARKIVPRMLVDATVKSTEVEILGKKYSSPLICAPVGVQSIMHPEGEEATAKACANLGIPYVLSTASTRSIEQVAAVSGDGERWYQLYWPKTDEITISLLDRAWKNGYTTLVVTLDTFQLGYRPGDLDNSYLPFIFGEGCQIGFSDPVFQQRYAAGAYNNPDKPSEGLFGLLSRASNPLQAWKLLYNAITIKKAVAWLTEISNARYRTWEDLPFLRKHWPGKILLKGIQSVDDAKKAAVMTGVIDGIIVSNHGGRQVDGAIASLDALENIMSNETVKNSALTVLFDSGIRTGSDILKAMALGANGVLIGRPMMWGLAMGGEAGVEHIFKCLRADLEITMASAGVKNITDISRDMLTVDPQSKL